MSPVCSMLVLCAVMSWDVVCSSLVLVKLTPIECKSILTFPPQHFTTVEPQLISSCTGCRHRKGPRH